MQRYCFILFMYFFAGVLNTYSQTPLIENLKNEILTSKDPEKKLQALFSFCDQKQSLNTDTLCKYAAIAKDISLNQKNILNIAMAEYNIAGCYVKRGLLDTALVICNANILKSKKVKNNVAALIKLTVLKAQIFIRSTKYKEGIAEGYSVLKYAEQNNDTMMEMVAKNAIGWANMEMDQNSEALRWFFLALNTTDNKIYHEKNSNIYSNIAAVYKEIHKIDSAEYFIKKAIVYSRKSQNLFYLANCLNILADIYIVTKREHLAEALLQEALSIRKQIGDPYYIVSDISELALYYASISQPEKGIALSQQGIQIASEFNLVSKLPYLYHALGENYKAAGNYLQYSKTLNKIQALKDSTYVANSAEARAEMDSRYNLEKKENLITVQKLDISRKNLLFYGLIILLFLTSLLTWMFFRSYRKNQQIRLLKMQSDEKMITARAILSAEEKERKRISRDLHDNIGAYATVLLANTEQLIKQASGQSIQQSAENVSLNARNIMGSLQETIWVLNNDIITVTDFIDRFKIYSKKILQPFPEVQMRFKEEIIKNFEMSPAEALHIFRIMQEALQNALKYARPKNIIVIAESNENISITIKDDGTGFDKNNITFGNGLIYIKERAKEAGYNLHVTSTQAGTEIRVEKSHPYDVL